MVLVSSLPPRKSWVSTHSWTSVGHKNFCRDKISWGGDGGGGVVPGIVPASLWLVYNRKREFAVAADAAVQNEERSGGVESIDWNCRPTGAVVKHQQRQEWEWTVARNHTHKRVVGAEREIDNTLSRRGTATTTITADWGGGGDAEKGAVCIFVCQVQSPLPVVYQTSNEHTEPKATGNRQQTRNRIQIYPGTYLIFERDRFLVVGMRGVDLCYR